MTYPCSHACILIHSELEAILIYSLIKPSISTFLKKNLKIIEAPWFQKQKLNWHRFQNNFLGLFRTHWNIYLFLKQMSSPSDGALTTCLQRICGWPILPPGATLLNVIKAKSS